MTDNIKRKMTSQERADSYTWEPVIRLIPQKTHKKMFGHNYNVPTNADISAIKNQLDQAGLSALKDTSEVVDLPVPTIDKNLPEWLDDVIERTYKQYFIGMNRLRALDYLPVNLPKKSPFFGWSKFTGNNWVRCDGISDTTIVHDFETYPDINGVMRPFMCCAVDTYGVVYSWLADVMKPLPEVVSFGEEVKLFVGHNCVSFDRRFIKEFYDFGHDKRMLDTYSLYSVLLGMSKEQLDKFRWARHMPNPPFSWIIHTSNNSLKDLSEYILGIEMDKTIREDLLKPKKVKGKLEVTPKEVIVNAMSEIWDYCVTDTINTGRIFDVFIDRVLQYETKIYLAGQLERSSIRINIDPEIRLKIAKVVQYNNVQLKKINQIVCEEFEKKVENNDHFVLSMLHGYVLKDWYERIYKSKKFKDYLADTDIDTAEIDQVVLPECLILLGWEYDDDKDSKRAPLKNNTLFKLKLVHQYLKDGNETKIECKGIKQWVTKIFKPANDKIDEAHISIAGKIAPVIIGLKWHGERLFMRGNTWGVEHEGEFIVLPHTKGKKNVGTPLSKDYRTMVTVGRFTADIDLAEFFDIVNETSLWEKFNERFKSIYIVDNVWLPEIVPSGTVTGRETGSLTPLLANPDEDGDPFQQTLYHWDGTAYEMPKPKKASSRAGSEMKSWFNVATGHFKINADYSGQESAIFAALIDALTRWCGLNIFSCLVYAGNSDLKTDIHSFVARYLSGECGADFPRTLAKNCNFANQFLCGAGKLSTMIFIALKGAMTEAQCYDIAVKFQEFTRGRMNFGKYYDGIASLGFNRVKELAKRNDQKCLLTGRTISDPLNARNCNEELTTRVNFSIQGTGQGLIDICSIVVRYMATLFDIPYNHCFMIHD